jgi:uncharacterized membrane protein YbaN (DUF454 family)
MAARDARLRVITPPPLPDGWFGKQWACAAGATEARGEMLGFMDADTRQAPDLVTRTVNAITSRGADLLSVAGTQELGGFWERMIQPQIFAIMLQRYGGTEIVNRSRHVSEKIANGQCLWVRRATYDALGGHGAVKHEVAEDLALAQLWFRAGRTVSLVLGLIGLVTPVLPTVPFIILASWAGMRSSRRVHDYLESHRVFGPILRDWREYGAVGRRTKLVATLSMAAGAAFLWWKASAWWLPAIVSAVMGTVTVWLWLRPEPPPTASGEASR